MEYGSELSKTVATFILQKILTDDTGLAYICQTYERFSHVAKVLGQMVLNLVKEPSSRLLKHVVRCYLRLSDNPRAKEALRACLPDPLKDATFHECLKDDPSTKKWLTQLIKNLEPFMMINPIQAQLQAQLQAQQQQQSSIVAPNAAATPVGSQQQPSISPSTANMNQFV
jgi:CCR4-NOT transcription complex subunit 9